MKAIVSYFSSLFTTAFRAILSALAAMLVVNTVLLTGTVISLPVVGKEIAITEMVVAIILAISTCVLAVVNRKTKASRKAKAKAKAVAAARKRAVARNKAAAAQKAAVPAPKTVVHKTAAELALDKASLQSKAAEAATAKAKAAKAAAEKAAAEALAAEKAAAEALEKAKQAKLAELNRKLQQAKVAAEKELESIKSLKAQYDDIVSLCGASKNVNILNKLYSESEVIENKIKAHNVRFKHYRKVMLVCKKHIINLM